MSGPTHQKEMAECRAMLGNEQKLRDGDREPATFHSLANLDTGLEGRFAKADYVAGQDEGVFYPRLPANSPWGDGPQPGPEMALGYSVNDLLPTGEPHEIARSLAELSAAGASAEADTAEVVAPTLVDHPTANVVERTSATSFARASAEETKTQKLHRPARRF